MLLQNFIYVKYIYKWLPKHFHEMLSAFRITEELSGLGNVSPGFDEYLCSLTLWQRLQCLGRVGLISMVLLGPLMS